MTTRTRIVTRCDACYKDNERTPGEGGVCFYPDEGSKVKVGRDDALDLCTGCLNRVTGVIQQEIKSIQSGSDS